MDFVHDQLATRRKLRVLTIIDTFSRFPPADEPRSDAQSTTRMLAGLRARRYPQHAGRG
jgi:hypothetical protein